MFSIQTTDWMCHTHLQWRMNNIHLHTINAVCWWHCSPTFNRKQRQFGRLLAFHYISTNPSQWILTELSVQKNLKQNWSFQYVEILKIHFYQRTFHSELYAFGFSLARNIIIWRNPAYLVFRDESITVNILQLASQSVSRYQQKNQPRSRFRCNFLGDQIKWWALTDGVYCDWDTVISNFILLITFFLK